MKSLRPLVNLLVVGMTVLFSAGCSSDDIDDAIDSAEGFDDRRPIDRSLLGINAFVNDTRFGSIASQFAEVRNTLGIRRARVLFSWNDQVQPTPSSTPNFAFYDDIVAAAPADMELLVILTGVPSWMNNSATWINENPRTTFVELWVKRVLARYGSNPKIGAYQVWNEPNNPSFPENTTLNVVNSPENYVELLALAENAIDDANGNVLVINAATTAINQNFPETRNYNRAMRDAGAIDIVDRWAIHYYGEQYENVVRDGGVEDFLDGLGKGVWITESGAQGVNSHLAYGEKVWPTLKEKIPTIERIYIYQFTEGSPPEVTYGLRNPSAQFPVSDLYIWLRG